MFPRDQDQQREWIYNEQVKTNELLTQLIERLKSSMPEPQKTTAIKPVNRTQRKPRGKAQ